MRERTLFWFNDEHRAKIEPLLPTKQPVRSRRRIRRIPSNGERSVVAWRTLVKTTSWKLGGSFVPSVIADQL
jgi:hypothetical protein